jgi:hypothetical protein
MLERKHTAGVPLHELMAKKSREYGREHARHVHCVALNVGR